jgi:signal transduction histidine kinase
LIGDSTRLRQITINLLSNAVKFTREGAVVMSVLAERNSPQRVALTVTVTDTGPGLNAEQQSRLLPGMDRPTPSIEGTAAHLPAIVSKKIQ